MEFNKNELHILKYLRFYKLLSIGCMIFGSCGIPFGFYVFFYHTMTYKEIRLNNALIGASISVLAMGYLMYLFLKLIEKFKMEFR